MWLFLAFLAIPLIEIALFIEVGGLIGLWPTLAIVVVTALVGAAAVRNQGFAALRKLQRSLEQLEDPAAPLAHGAMILFSGALLLTPGFFTDTVGFLLLVPQVRALVIRHAIRRIIIHRSGPGGPPPHAPQPRDDVIEGEWEEAPPPKNPTHRPRSGWTHH